MNKFNEPISDFPHITENGRKRGTTANLKHLFEGYGITISYNEITKKQSIAFNADIDNGYSDLAGNANIGRILSLLSLNGVPRNVMDSMPTLYQESITNPVLDFIQCEPWDKQDRLQALANTLTVAEHDRAYANLALKTWLVQCVAAADGAKQTGNKNAIAKYELALILQGKQGVRKTSWFKRLLPDGLKDYIIDGAHLDPADNDSLRNAISCWICELGELDSTFRRADISRLKAFLSKQVDTIRLPYDRCASDFKRRTSFCGSVNPELFLVDSTGNRRFLPVQVLGCNHQHDINMQQLWAQVWQMYRDGEQWWCSRELEQMLEERHDRHTEINPIHETIASHFDIEQTKPNKWDAKHFSATQILQECGIREPKQGQAKCANEYLKHLGFDSVKIQGNRGFWIVKRAFLPD